MNATQKANLETAREILLRAAREYHEAFEALEIALTDEAREVPSLDASDLDFQAEAMLVNDGPLFTVDE